MWNKGQMSVSAERYHAVQKSVADVLCLCSSPSIRSFPRDCNEVHVCCVRFIVTMSRASDVTQVICVSTYWVVSCVGLDACVSASVCVVSFPFISRSR